MPKELLIIGGPNGSGKTTFALIGLLKGLKQVGHHVKTEDVIRRLGRSKNNFWNIYKSLTDSWYIYNNSNVKAEDVAMGKEIRLLL